MTSTSLTTGRAKRAAADAALQGAATLWFVTAVLGQWAFVYYIAGFYGSSTLTGNFHAWSRNTDLLKGYVAGDTAGNLFFAAHVLLAAVISFGGALQLVPQIRARALLFHRWNGRLFMLTALGISLDGLYLVWGRHATTGLLGSVTVSLDAVLIIAFVIVAWLKARAGQIAAHRRWALRGYLVANAQWFFRVGVFGMMMVAKPWVGSFYVVWGFGCYLAPLAVLELYLRAQNGAGPAGRLAMAGALSMVAVLIVVGTLGVYLNSWRPLL